MLTAGGPNYKPLFEMDVAQLQRVLSDHLVPTGTAEWDEGLRLVARQQAAGTRIRTLGADKAYDVRRFVGPLRAAGVTPHVAQQITVHRGSQVDGGERGGLHEPQQLAECHASVQVVDS